MGGPIHPLYEIKNVSESQEVVKVDLLCFFVLDLSMALVLLIPWFPGFLLILCSLGEAQEKAKVEVETGGCAETGKTQCFNT